MARRCCQGRAARLPRLLCGPWGRLQGQGLPHQGEGRGGEPLHLEQWARARARLATHPAPPLWGLQDRLGQRRLQELVLALLPLPLLVVQAQARALPLRRLAVQEEAVQEEETIRVQPRRQQSLPA